VHGSRPDVDVWGPDMNELPPDVEVWGPDKNELPQDVEVWGPDKNESRPDINVWRSDMNGSISDIMMCFLDHDLALAPTNSLWTSKSGWIRLAGLTRGPLGGESAGSCQPASESTSRRTRSRCHESTYGRSPNGEFGEGHICLYCPRGDVTPARRCDPRSKRGGVTHADRGGVTPIGAPDRIAEECGRPSLATESTLGGRYPFLRRESFHSEEFWVRFLYCWRRVFGPMNMPR
jgi:hypothetical protein